MDIVRLPVGQRAPIDADCITVEEQADATYELTTSALCRAADADESVSIISASAYSSVEAAEAAGIAWAMTVGVERLFIGTGTIQRPMVPTEIDRSP